ncbi:prothymosin alpha-like [Homalodisca vitripennis]|uniref:prothymosin alpha-like n=1 Tax=Homalodisca vitripennis TaxID=197043 RepID=UPI001EE9E576|nr:prothymosin alpha-like [Homalodisca vitripennis]
MYVIFPAVTLLLLAITCVSDIDSRVPSETAIDEKVEVEHQAREYYYGEEGEDISISISIDEEDEDEGFEDIDDIGDEIDEEEIIDEIFDSDEFEEEGDIDISISIDEDDEEGFEDSDEIFEEIYR